MIHPATTCRERRDSTIFAGRDVLITGGLGFIGSNLALDLAALGANITIADALLEPFGGNLENIRDLWNRVPIDFSDLRNFARVEHLVRGKEFIFHLAGQVSHVDSMHDPMVDLGVNAAATLNLLEACRRHNPGARIVFASTRQVYGRAGSLPVSENQLPDPIDANGISKLAAEQYLLLYHKVHGLHTTVLRLTNTYGPRQKLGDTRQGVAGFLIHRALAGETLPLYGGGAQLRDFNYVDDVTRALLRVAHGDTYAGKIFNLGGERAWTLRQFAEILQSLCDCEIETVPFPPGARQIDIGDYHGDFSRLREATGWSPLVGLEEGLARTVAFWLTQATSAVSVTADPNDRHNASARLADWRVAS